MSLNPPCTMEYSLHLLKNTCFFAAALLLWKQLENNSCNFIITVLVDCSPSLFLHYDQRFSQTHNEQSLLVWFYHCMMRPLLKNACKTPRPSVTKNVYFSYAIHTFSLAGLPFLHSCGSNGMTPTESSCIPVTN